MTTQPLPLQGRVRVLRRLTGLRAFAALAVFGTHLYSHKVASLPWGLSDLGGLGVPFFFVLSGFVIAWGTEPGLKAGTFYRRRLARVYPSDLATLLIAALVPVVAVGRSWKAALANAFMMQAWYSGNDIVYGMNGVSWSLSCEAFFYGCFPLIAVAVGRMPVRRAMAWAVAGLALAAIAYRLHPHYAAHLPLVRLSEFFLGVVAGTAYREGLRLRLDGFAVSAVLVLALLLSWKIGGPMSFAVMAIPFLLLICHAANLDIARQPGWLASPAMVFAGEVSFAFYLVHELVIVNLCALFPIHPALVAVPMLLLASVSCALALHFLVERPCNRLLRDSAPSAALARIDEGGLAAQP